MYKIARGDRGTVGNVGQFRCVQRNVRNGAVKRRGQFWIVYEMYQTVNSKKQSLIVLYYHRYDTFNLYLIDVLADATIFFYFLF